MSASRADAPSVSSLGWAPGEQFRQKEFVRANLRAKRLRRDQTPTEKKLWRLLRQEPDARFRRQVAIRDFVFDFGEYGARLLIEVDGGVHELPENALRDVRKNEAAKAAGFNLLRVTNNDVWGRPDWVLDQVRIHLKAPHPPTPSPQGRGGENMQ